MLKHQIISASVLACFKALLNHTGSIKDFSITWKRSHTSLNIGSSQKNNSITTALYFFHPLLIPRAKVFVARCSLAHSAISIAEPLQQSDVICFITSKAVARKISDYHDFYTNSVKVYTVFKAHLVFQSQSCIFRHKIWVAYLAILFY